MKKDWKFKQNQKVIVVHKNKLCVVGVMYLPNERFPRYALCHPDEYFWIYHKEEDIQEINKLWNLLYFN